MRARPAGSDLCITGWVDLYTRQSGEVCFVHREKFVGDKIVRLAIDLLDRLDIGQEAFNSINNSIHNIFDNTLLFCKAQAASIPWR